MRAVNLIPADQRSGASKITGDSDGAAFIVIGVIVGLAILMFLYGKAHREVSSRQSEVASLTARAQDAQEQANKLTPYTSFISLQNERVNEVSQLIGTRFDWAHALHELGRVLPTNVSLSSVQGTIGSGSTSAPAATSSSTTSSASTSVSSATPPGSTPTLDIAGCTDNQSDVAVALARLRLINGVTEVTLQSSTKGGSAGGSCGANSPAFTAVITFAGLPTPVAPSTGSSTTTAAATTPPSSTATTTSSTTTAAQPTTSTSPAPTTASTNSTSANGNS